MTSRERMLTALSNGRPDRLPCQVHGWIGSYLKQYLGGMDWYQAYERFGMDYAIYVSPSYAYDERDRADWQAETIDGESQPDGSRTYRITIKTPKGILTTAGASNQYTAWTTEYLIKSEADFHLWNQFVPVAVSANFDAIREARDKLGDRGIVRSHPFSFGQGSPWQSLCTLYGTEHAIMLGMDNPEFLHYALGEMLRKTVRATELWKGTPADMVETGGGAGSNTVISPRFFEEFSLPYDIIQHAALHEAGVKIVYHLCGGVMHMLDLVAGSGADGLETMTPPSMGGDCDLREASRRVGDRLFFIGGFDQNAGSSCQ